MDAPSRHAIAFGAYVLATALTLLLAPDLLLALLQMPAATEPWLTVAAGIALALGSYYVAAGRAGARWFFEASVPGRCAFAAVAFYAAWRHAAPALALFGAVDLVTAGLMFWQLRGARAAEAA
jgi:hypothetical protein